MSKSIYTFWELLQECPIVIPQVQRDYAYGRDDDKAKDVIEKILNSIHQVLVPSTLKEGQPPLTMDFIYGSRDDVVGLKPLDGQQRLTTLFLLHLFASIVDGKSSERQYLKNFCYETRQSANNFCKSLIDDYTYRIDIKNYSLSEQIKDNPKFLASYQEDPTISSMLVVLDKIAAKFIDIESLWAKLTEERRIIFYFHPLDKFGLSDDLYIKMNSRGKSLTNYELYKSDFIEFLGNNYPSYKKLFSDKLDGEWTDLIWKLTKSETRTTKDVRSVDEGLINMFSNFSVILYHLRSNDNFSDNNGKDSKYLLLPHNSQFTNQEEIETLYQMFFTVEIALTGDGVNDYWNDLFYLNDKVVSEDSDRIRLFWPQKEDIFTMAFKHRFSRAQMIVFYAIYFAIKNNIDKHLLAKRMRHLRNLIVNSEYQLRGANLHGMLMETEKFIVEGCFPSGEYFNSLQVEEELEKEQLSNWPDLWKYENHSILRGSIELFIKTGAIDLLAKFNKLYNDSYSSNTDKLRRAFLIAGEGGSDYMQYQAKMQTDSYKQRWFVCNSDMWHSFFTWNRNRINQEAIIDCLRQIPDDFIEMDNYISNGLSKLSTKSWKYYMVKYPGEMKTKKASSQGVYHWDDLQNKPLEVIMLNSSTHSDNLLEWNIINLTVKESCPDSCTINPHGHAPVNLQRANSFLNANQIGWTISTYEPYYLIENLLRLKKQGETDDKYHFADDNCERDGLSFRTVIVPDDIDYVEFALELIKDVESVYIEHHRNDIKPADILNPETLDLS